MERLSASSPLLSHPGKQLSQHLLNTARLVECFLEENKALQFPFLFPKLALAAALFHDIGKSTAFFQEYIKEENDRKKQILKNKPETHHSLLSALFTFFLTSSFCEDPYLPFLAYLAVKHHHSDLLDLRDDLRETEIEDAFPVLETQIENINEDAFLFLMEEIKQVYPFVIVFKPKDIREWLKSFPSILRGLRRRHRKEGFGLEGYFTLNYLYSLLIDADKSEVVVGSRRYFERRDIPYDAVDAYKGKQQWGASSINLLREEAYKEAMEKVIELEKNIYSLNLPTGLGKTLSSFAFALRLRKKVEETKGVKARIIYCAPFLSILEQNFSIIRDVLDTEESPLLIKHHHLSDIFYRTKDEFEDEEKARVLLEGWNSEVVVTTFVQLFHTLVSNRNSSLRKFHRLANSILILDEVQSIPHKYWELCKELLSYICKNFNTYVLLVTATSPLIFKKEETEPIAKSSKYYPLLNRVTLLPQIGKPKSLSEFFRDIKIEKDKSYLFIFNTIASAREFCEMLSRRVNRDCLTFLSTHITPKQREERIWQIREGKYRFVVSTQLVEAGVDIDFDVVYRDFAPLDALIQSAGRCNRNSKGRGIVYVALLKREDNNRSYASYIYDPVLLDITKKILEDKNVIEESDFALLIEEYYKKTRELLSTDKAREILAAIRMGKYAGDENEVYISDFRLIEEEMPKVDVFVEIDEEAQAVWQKYCEIKGIVDRWERRREFERIKGRFYNFLISVPFNSRNLPPQVEGFFYISNNELERYYDHLYGFKCEPELAIW
ncbi:MAG: CRISPR-associated helicase Cas3' [bacterium]